VNDVVTESGNSYIARFDSLHIDPRLAGAAWALLAARGEMGLAGTNGTNGKNGTDGLNGTNGTNGTNGMNGQSGTTGQSVVMKQSDSSAQLLTPVPLVFPGPLTPVPDLSLEVNVLNSTAAVMVSTDGGVQIFNSSSVGAYVIVDITLWVDVPGYPSKQIGRRRLLVANAVPQFTNANWAFSVVDTQLPGGPYVYTVKAQLMTLNSNGLITSVSGGSTSALRGMLTAVVINK
jgi:hypothetical protein